MTAPALYIPHGGGPLPLLDDPGHSELTAFLRDCPQLFGRPTAILVISAHWEEDVATIQSGEQPELLFDYYGLPEQSYQLRYPAPGAPELARDTGALLQAAGIDARADDTRGFDHGVFVPLLLMYPGADIPCLQLSLTRDMDPARHIALGRALAPLREQGVLILGSGSPFHNMNAFRDGDASKAHCQVFDDWLYDTCCSADVDTAASRLTRWEQAPHARYAHPREEHLLPLHVCFGAAIDKRYSAERIFNGDMMGYRMSAFLWR